MASLGIILPIDQKLKLNDENKSEFLIINKKEIEKNILEQKKLKKQIVSFLRKLKLKNNSSNNEDKKISRSKIGYIKEGYDNIYVINPIDRYNFVVDRYNEEFNKISNITLSRVPSVKAIRRIYDLYTWVCRLFFGVFFILIYYCYKYKWSRHKLDKLDNHKNRAGMLAYRQYLFNENRDYYTNSVRDNPSFSFILLCSLFLIISLYLIIIFFLIMIIPNLIFTIYLLLAFIIHLKNKYLLKEKDIFINMIHESKLDEKGQLNDYLIVDLSTLKYYESCSYFEKLVKLSELKDMTRPQSFMLYGDLFEREHEIISRAFYKQVLGICGLMAFGFYFYLI